jgi:phenylalanyl-tRNA synthetase beta chain|tara:strand:- start:371 stop:2719 length:2349 start_codon:yes stop_codon:yes gene_type:complete
MKFTKEWLNDHLNTSKNEAQIIEKLNYIGLEVEKVEPVKNELSDFIVAKIIKAEKHPNADRLKLCHVDIGKKDLVKVVCGGPNAKDNLLTIYAPPGSVIPKNNMKLEVSKIRGETSYGMLCSESELNISNEADGIIELNQKYQSKIGRSYFDNSKNNVIELSITPNRPDCLGIRGIARDLSATGIGKLIDNKIKKVKKNSKQIIKVKIENSKNQACTIFGSCLIKNINNQESPDWLKKRILSLGLRPISAVVDITNYVMFDLNRPLHAYDADKIHKGIIIRNSKKGENFKALDNKDYNLDNGMCVISDHQGVLGLGGIIGGTKSGTELNTKNILLESAYFDPEITRKTAKKLDLNSDAKFRFERGIDPNSILLGLEKASEMIVEICGGEASKIDIQSTKIFKSKKINFDPKLASKTVGIQIKTNEIIKILEDLGFNIKKKSKTLDVQVPSWRPDINGDIDLVEEIIRIKGFDKIQSIEPEKKRTKPTLDFFQKNFHLAQRSVASKGYLETITWSFTEDKLNNIFRENYQEVKIINPISSDLNVLRSSLYPNLINVLNKNIDRGFEDQSLFEIGPLFIGNKPGQQITVVSGVKKENLLDVYGIKKDLVQTLIELGIDKNQTTIDINTPSYYHPGRSGSIITKKDKNLLAYFGEIHPKIINKVYGFEIFLENLVKFKNQNKADKPTVNFSDYQKSDRDFAFVVEKDLKAQDLVEIIWNVDSSLIKNVKIFDVYQGENIPSDKKSIALKVTIQSDFKTLNEKDLNEISMKIISNVEEKANAKLRS